MDSLWTVYGINPAAGQSTKVSNPHRNQLKEWIDTEPLTCRVLVGCSGLGNSFGIRLINMVPMYTYNSHYLKSTPVKRDLGTSTK